MFDKWDHDLAFLPEERIMLLVGPNGSGKTTILRLINMLFKQLFGQLCGMPFQEINVLFDDGTRLSARRKPKRSNPDTDLLPLVLTFHRDGTSKSFQPPKPYIDPRELEMPLSAIESYVPMLVRVGPQKWTSLETGAVLDLTDVLTTFPDYFPPNSQGVKADTPDWLRDIEKSLEVSFIETERLTRVSLIRSYDPIMRITRTVNHYSERLGKRIQDAITR